MSNNLFDGFTPVNAKAWKQKIQADLKGADYNETLIWNTNEDINVKPFYHSDHFKEKKLYHIPTSNWFVGQYIFVTTVEIANKKAINAIQRGAESIIFIISQPTTSIEELLQNIDLSSTPIHLKLLFLDSKFINNLNAHPYASAITVHTDIIGNLAKSGNWYTDISKDHEQLNNIVTTNTQLKSTLSVDVSLYQNAGATIVQQLAYATAHANEYLNHFNNNLKQDITFNVSVGTNYFFEIAKLRALRLLWSTLATEYNVSQDCNIVAFPTKRNKTIYDYNTNMLRTSTECMSAILGGADTIYNLPYDALYHKDNEFGERISRNQLLILKKESYFGEVTNASDGSYYIETITQQLAEKALDIFKSIENGGGFLQQLKEGTIQKKIKASAEKEQEQFNTGELVLLGTNKHPNENDRMKDNLELYPFLKTNARKTLIEPILPKRLAETSEQNRLKTE
ncbi:methylmalonyl-CoA mutase subunit beta [Pontimicrobium sp. MEBiC06410]